MEELGISLSSQDQAEVLKRVVSLGDSKETITVDDLPFIIADVLERRDFHHIELLACSFTSGLNQESTASIRVKVNGAVHESSGLGNGGFDAFIDAIRKVFPPSLDFPELVDYWLRIPRGGSTSALTEVSITWRDGPRTMRTRGVHANQVLAGVGATLRMLNMKLHQEAEPSRG